MVLLSENVNLDPTINQVQLLYYALHLIHLPSKNYNKKREMVIYNNNQLIGSKTLQVILNVLAVPNVKDDKINRIDKASGKVVLD